MVGKGSRESECYVRKLVRIGLLPHAVAQKTNIRRAITFVCKMAFAFEDALTASQSVSRSHMGCHICVCTRAYLYSSACAGRVCVRRVFVKGKY